MSRITDCPREWQRKTNKQKECSLKENLLETVQGCCCAPGGVLDSFGCAHLPHGLRVDGWEPGRGWYPPHGSVAEHPVPKTGIWEPDWLSFPQRAQSCVVISCLFPLVSSSLQLFPWHRKFQLSSPQLYLCPDSLLPPSFFPHQPHHFSFLSERRRVLFCHPPLGGAAPFQDRWLPGLFLTVSREEDSTTYFENCSLIDSSQSRNFLLIPDLKFDSCNWNSFLFIPLEGEGSLRSSKSTPNA